MASIKFEIKKEDINKLDAMFEKAGNQAENATNSFLHDVASKNIIKSITMLMPVSNRKKIHAKDSSPFESQNINMGIIIHTKAKFNYLGFPDMATGTSRKNEAKKFMEKGLDNEYDAILKGIMDELSKFI